MFCLKRTSMKLQSKQNDPDCPNIRVEGVAEPRYDFRGYIVRSPTCLSFPLAIIGQLTGEPEVPQLYIIVFI